MTEAVQIELIRTVAPTAAALIAAWASFGNRREIREVKATVQTVDVKVDGNLTAMRNDLNDAREALMKLRGQNSEVIGQLIEKEIEKNGGTKE